MLLVLSRIIQDKLCSVWCPLINTKLIKSLYIVVCWFLFIMLLDLIYGLCGVGFCYLCLILMLFYYVELVLAYLLLHEKGRFNLGQVWPTDAVPFIMQLVKRDLEHWQVLITEVPKGSSWVFPLSLTFIVPYWICLLWTMCWLNLITKF